MPATILDCPILRPTLREIESCSFEEYITKHEKLIFSRGVCKIVAPDGWAPCPSAERKYSNLNFEITKPIRQNAIGNRGVFRMVYTEEKSVSNRELQASEAAKAAEQQRCNAERAQRSGTNDVERNFWKNISLQPPLYGADVLGSLFDEKLKGLNLKHLDTVLTTVLEENGCELPGVTKPYLYFGTSRSVFAWHTEDLDLYSVNYLHFGAPKQWYIVPPEHRQRFEQVMRSLAPGLFMQCSQFLRHKELLVSPQLLDQHMIPYMKMTQQPRDFVIVAPGAYHAGFNWGYNAAESVNFATKRWVPVGARAGVCKCSGDSVTIDMRLFRHLVPRKLLPDGIFVDTSSEDEGSSEAGSGSEGEEDEDEEEAGDNSAAGEEEPPSKRRRPNASLRTRRPSAPAPTPPKPPAPRSTNTSRKAAIPTPRAARAAARTAADSNTRRPQDSNTRRPQDSNIHRQQPLTVRTHTRSRSRSSSTPRMAHAHSNAPARTPPATTSTRGGGQQAGEGAKGGSALMARLVGSQARANTSSISGNRGRPENSSLIGKRARANNSTSGNSVRTNNSSSAKGEAGRMGSTRTSARQAQRVSPKDEEKAASAPARGGHGAIHAPRRTQPSLSHKAAAPVAAASAQATPSAQAAALPQPKAAAPAQPVPLPPVRSSPRTNRKTISLNPTHHTADNPQPQAHMLTTKSTSNAARIPHGPTCTQAPNPPASPPAPTLAAAPAAPAAVGAAVAEPGLRSRLSARQEARSRSASAFVKNTQVSAPQVDSPSAHPGPAHGSALPKARALKASSPQNRALTGTHPLQLKQLKPRSNGAGSSRGGGRGGPGLRKEDDGLGWWILLPRITKPRTLATRPHKKVIEGLPSLGLPSQEPSGGQHLGLGGQQHVTSGLLGPSTEPPSRRQAGGQPTGASWGLGGQHATKGLQGPSSEAPRQRQAGRQPTGASWGLGGPHATKGLQGPSSEAPSHGLLLRPVWGSEQQQVAHGQGLQSSSHAAAGVSVPPAPAVRVTATGSSPLQLGGMGYVEPQSHAHAALQSGSLSAGFVAADLQGPLQGGGLGHVEPHPGQCQPFCADLQGPDAQQRGLIQPQQHQHPLSVQQQQQQQEQQPQQHQYPRSVQQQQQQQQQQHPLSAQQQHQHLHQQDSASDAADSSGTSAVTVQLHQEQEGLPWVHMGKGLTARATTVGPRASRNRSSQERDGDELRETSGMGQRSRAVSAGIKHSRGGVQKAGGVKDVGEESRGGLLFLQHLLRRPRAQPTRARANMAMLQHWVRVGRGDEVERVPPPPLRPHQASSLFSAVLKSGGQRTAAVAAALSRAVGFEPSEPQDRLPVDGASTARAQRNIKPTWKFLG